MSKSPTFQSRKVREEMLGRNKGVNPPGHFVSEVRRGPDAKVNPGLRFRIEYQPGVPNPAAPKIPGLYTLTAIDGGTLYSGSPPYPMIRTLSPGETVAMRSLSYAAQSVCKTAINGPLFWGLNALQQVANSKGKVPRITKAIMEAVLAPLDYSAPLTPQVVVEEASEAANSGPVVPHEKNATSLWLEKQLADGKLLKLCALQVAKKLQRSSSAGMVEDLVQNYFIKLIRRDGLKVYLDEGRNIPLSLIASFCVRSAYTDVRDSGKDPIARELMGARTETERKKGVHMDTFQTMQVPMDSRVSLEKDDSTGYTSIREISDLGESSQEVTDSVNLDQVWDRIRRILMDETGSMREARLACQVLRLSFQEMSQKEIAEAVALEAKEVGQILFKAQTHLKPYLREIRADLGLG